MHTTAPTYEVVELVRFQANVIESQLARLSRKRTFLDMILGVLRAPVSFLAQVAVAHIDKVSHRMATQAASFHGLAIRVHNAPKRIQIDPAGELTRQLAIIQADVIEMRDSTWKLADYRDAKRARYGEITKALRRAASSAHELNDAVEVMKSAVAEHDARSISAPCSEVLARLQASAAAMDLATSKLWDDDYSDLDESLLEEARKTLEAVAAKG